MRIETERENQLFLDLIAGDIKQPFLGLELFQIITKAIEEFEEFTYPMGEEEKP